MDLQFTPEELAFRDEVRSFLKDQLPEDLSHKVRNGLQLTKQDMEDASNNLIHIILKGCGIKFA